MPLSLICSFESHGPTFGPTGGDFFLEDFFRFPVFRPADTTEVGLKWKGKSTCNSKNMVKLNDIKSNES